ELQKRIQQEIDALPPNPGPEDLRQLEETRHLMQETLRMYPPLWALAREATQDTTVNGIDVPKGTPVFLSLLEGNRDPANWGATGHDPQEFHPERFRDKTPRLQTFGGGAHMCPGKELATTENFLMLTKVLSRFEVRAEGPLKFWSGATLYPLNPAVEFTPRP
ncbi:MAG: cytochrome P450, partial [Candidatus Eremiobacteraeota bacterium]|nr:cytochrome P450 [Candidatus Eremiobacteraeota bacterium]